MITTNDIRMTAGQTVQITMVARNSKGAPIDLTGATVFLSVTADLKIASMITLKSPLNGIVIDADQTGAGKGKCVATIDASLTASLMALGDGDPYFWDAWVVDATTKKFPIVATSRLSLFPAVTRTFV